jgi:hypothetical protein
MSPVIEYTNGKPQIKRVETFCSMLNSNLPDDSVTYSEILDVIDKSVLSEHPKVKMGALNNCHGDWYEWILAARAWNFRIKNNRNFMLMLLPNVSSFDVAKLYDHTLFGYINDLRNKVLESADVQLITSNPDFVIIDTTNIELDESFLQPITEFTAETIERLQKMYRHFTHRCSFNDINGYLSVKTTFRPDRRLQLSHEGSLMKATYVHLQTRDWIINPKGLRYYGAATHVSDADRRGLRTVATHSIINVQSIPQAAVDDVFTINSNEDTDRVFNIILNE